MNKEIIERIAKTMIIKVKCYKSSKASNDDYESYIYFKEIRAMEQMLEMMGIDYKFTYDENYEITAIKIEGITVYE